MIIKELFKKFFDYQFILIADYEELNKMLNHKRIFWLDIAKAYGIIRQFKDEMQRVLMKQRILRKEYDSQVIFWVCD